MARPQAFNNSEVLQSAMHAYWQSGFKTSISDLEIATGISRSSLYNSFGDKNQLFKLCMDLYLDQTIEVMNRIFNKTTFKEGIFDLMVEAATTNFNGRGCMLYNSFGNFNNLNVSNRKVLLDNFAKLKSTFNSYAGKSLENGELDPGVDLDAFITSIMSTIAGIRTFRMVGVDSAELIRGARHTVDGFFK